MGSFDDETTPDTTFTTNNSKVYIKHSANGLDGFANKDQVEIYIEPKPIQKPTQIQKPTIKDVIDKDDVERKMNNIALPKEELPNPEKSTRSMEIIISNVSPKTHFISKILSSNLFVIIQGALLIIFDFRT